MAVLDIGVGVKKSSALPFFEGAGSHEETNVCGMT